MHSRDLTELEPFCPGGPDNGNAQSTIAFEEIPKRGLAQLGRRAQNALTLPPNFYPAMYFMAAPSQTTCATRRAISGFNRHTPSDWMTKSAA